MRVRDYNSSWTVPVSCRAMAECHGLQIMPNELDISTRSDVNGLTVSSGCTRFSMTTIDATEACCLCLRCEVPDKLWCFLQWKKKRMRRLKRKRRRQRSK